ncbi:alpha-amylase [Ceratobasidium sp. AG-Ba]|nr:alpha-amylase [Ceratobasidium sp. AG-Ba]
MTAQTSGTGIGGSFIAKYNYPGTYQTQDFHHCGHKIGTYTNRTEVQFCELDDLSDLATETDHVRGRIATYMKDLQSLGVAGLRLDASKHMPAADIASILSRLSSKPYITQEVIFGAGEPILPSEYVGNGDVQEFRYTSALLNAFTSNGISGLNDIASRGWITSSNANVFVANHDTERTPGASLNYTYGAAYPLAHVFMLAYPYGTPTVLSSYKYAYKDDGSPSNGAGSCSGNGGANGWQCQHRWFAVAGMVKWRNAVTGTVNNWISGTKQQIGFGRGSTGYVVINNADAAWTHTFTTPLAAGTYCDAISGVTSGGKCTGASYTVSGGTFTATIGPQTAIALYTGATGATSQSTVTVNFKVNATTTYGDNVFLSGVGSWEPDSAVLLSSSSYPIWTISVQMAPGAAFSYKYLKKLSSGSVVWESDPNRSFTAPASGALTLSDTWR